MTSTAIGLGDGDLAQAAPSPVPASAALRAEWSKFWSARAPRRNLVLGLVLGIAMSVLIALVTALTFDDWPESERAAFDPILYPLAGSLLLAIFFVAVGVNVVASEYGSGMIRLTLTATPKRSRVLYAKSVVVAVTTATATAVATAGMLGFSQVIYAANDLPTASATDWGLWRAMFGSALAGTVFPVIAVALTFCLRSTAAALSTTLALIFVPGMFGGLLPVWWRENVLSLLPGPASDSVAIGHLDSSSMHLHPALAGLIVVAWVIAIGAVARRLLERRDA